MSFSFRFATAAALTLCALPGHAQQSRPTLWDVFSVENIMTSVLHSALGSARVLADIRYDQISVDPVALKITLTGVTIAPLLPDLPPGACDISAMRATISGGAIDRISEARIRLALDGVDVNPGCFPREVSTMARAMGFQSLRVDRIESDTLYSYASGGAITRISADIPKISSLNAVIDMDYISYRMDLDTEEPVVAVDLNSAELTIQDQGAWDLAKNFLPAELQAPDALSQIVQGAIEQVLQQENPFDDPALSDRQRAFAVQAGEIAGGFDGGRRKVVLATRIAPAPFRISENSARDFRRFFDVMNPTVLANVPALTQVVSITDLNAALNSEAPPANAFDLGRALLTGVGAPRNIASGLRLLAPLARDGNADASLLIAKAVTQSKPNDAYTHALLATAAGLPGSLALLDRIERTLPYADAIAAQNALMAGPQDTLYSDLAAMRTAAREFTTGTNRPRSWRAAYYWASMAAAAGDATAAALRDDISETMRLRGDAEAWAAEAESLENGVLRDWIGKDVPGRLR